MALRTDHSIKLPITAALSRTSLDGAWAWYRDLYGEEPTTLVVHPDRLDAAYRVLAAARAWKELKVEVDDLKPQEGWSLKGPQNEVWTEGA